jgi:two-component system chemotaxis response regulator CheB
VGKIRVLVVEDSLTVRRRLVEVLSGDAELEVVAEAEDGKGGVEACAALRPDVVTMDVVLPVMSGLAATEYIMAYVPTPILVVSASSNRGALFKTYDALAAGAVDVIEKPLGDEPDGQWEAALVRAVKRVARIKVITHPRGRRAPRPAVEGPVRAGEAAPRLVAVGASTGGPAAVAHLLGALDADFPLPILLVIHIGALFASTLADWLDGVSALRVAFARDGEPLPPCGAGRVLMAPPDRHLELCDGRLRLTCGPERHSCRPSVDVLFESVARDAGDRGLACLLTGMGRDGAAGLLAIKRAGGTTVAQDEATSVVFGMPREAVALGAADHVLALEAMAPFLSRRAGVRR